MTLPPGLLQRSLKLHSADSYIDLYVIQVDDSTGFFVTSYPTAVVFDGITYSPWPISGDPDEQDTRGNIPGKRLTICNIDKLVQTQLRQAGVERGSQVIRRRVSSATLGTATEVIEDRWIILQAVCTELSVVLELGHENPLQKPFGVRISRGRCNKPYGGILCGYDRTRAGALADCDRTAYGANGCVVHGDDEVAAGLPRLHPLHFGGAPSIPKGPYA